MEVPFKDVVFCTSDPQGSAAQLLPFLFPGRKPDDVALRISALAQGTTNGVRPRAIQLFKVTIDAATTDAVLVKVYGDGTNITIDRD
ncbi:hypothetical protein F53441_14531, partial [Fusarium austroafricanum]